ncbi:MAG: 50S ribosomal protein L24 [Omnitrophica bacterium GWA2_52_12]|nr:MAG: 50S ribosomal protein L24 [Omnitrophica bacterium GWA2_52_12]
MKLKKNDNVVVISGKDRGKKGKILRVFPTKESVIVEKINYQTIYLRRSQENPKGGVSKMESPIHVSKLMLVCPRTGKPSRVGYSKLADGVKQRVAKKSGEIL